MNTQVGPFGVEVLEGLKRLRVVLGPNEHGLSFDLTWEGSIPPQVEPQHFIRSQERVIFDSKRMAQTGRWAGSITVDGETLEVTPDRWWGIRDRSYGLEPDWKHGMYQGPDLVVQGVGYDLSRPEDAARMWGMVDAVGRFDYDGQTGYGLYEYWALGDHPSFR
jgi:hypothetical protein